MHHDPTSGTINPDSVFDVVLVGIDDTLESLVATVQAGALRGAGSRLVLVAVAERYLAAHAGLAAGHASTKVAETLLDDLARAERLVDADETVVANGRLVRVLGAEGERRDATLLVVGGRPHGRLRARTLGGHDDEVLADPRCSVLIARPGWGPRRPDRVVLCPASTESRFVGEVARRLVDRLRCELVVAVGLEEDPDLDVVSTTHPDAVLDPGSRIDAAANAVTAQSLLVVGDELGIQAVRRIAFGVPCSVLVVHHAAGGAAQTA